MDLATLSGFGNWSRPVIRLAMDSLWFTGDDLVMR
jgi:hypothetical protein